MTDIVELLRDHDRHIRGRLIEGLTDLVIDDMVEAADEIERLREANDKMVRALNAISCQDADCKDDGVVWCAQRARSALEEKE